MNEQDVFGELLRHYRLAANLTQEALAEQAGLSARGVADLERGVRNFPYPQTVQRLATALQLDEPAYSALLSARRPNRRHEHSRPTTEAVPAQARHNLPVQLTTFVGRERELDELRGGLSSTRLLTATGPGGIGKTRLALEVAHGLVDQYPDGVWLVELAALTEPALVPDAVATSLGVRARGHVPLHQLATMLRAKRLLLVLDNCEHLVAACAAVADALLRGCPSVRILATSREPLGVAGETIWRLSPLSVPAAVARGSVAAVLASEAGRLFVDRVCTRMPAFVLSDETAAATARICRGLDGIPLALELAAPRVSVISVQQMAEQLGNTLRVLAIGPRAAPPRQQTFRTALEWSLALLSEAERRCFAHVAVFVGGWTLESAMIATSDGSQPLAALQLLGSLVDKSLVIAEVGEDGTMRYRLLEPIRQYAHELLDAADESAAVRARHADYFIELGEQAEPHLYGGRSFASWLDRLQPDRSNLRSALRWCAEHGEVERGVRLGGAVWRWWFERGTAQECREWLDLLLHILQVAPRNAHRARALNGAGVLACRQDDFESAQAMLEESRALSATLGDGRALAACLHNLAFVAEHRADYPAARRLYEDALATHREYGDRVGEALTLSNLGWSLMESGDYALACEVSASSVAEYTALGDELSAAWPRMSLAWALVQSGNGAAGDALFAQTLAFLRDHAYPPRDEAIPVCLEGLSAAAASQHQSERALRLAAAADHLRAELGRPLIESERGLAEAWLAPLHQVLGEETVAALWIEGRLFPLDQAIGYALAAPAPSQMGVSKPNDGGTSGVLSPREREVALLVAHGLTNRRIADQLVISKRTADGHIASILGKLSLANRAEIAVWAVAHRLPADQLV